MASQNKWFGIGRLTRDPEFRSFQNGGRVANFGFAFASGSKKDAAGNWEEISCFVECKAFDREKGRKNAEFCERFLRKGGQVAIEGKLVLEQWTDQSGNKKSMIKIEVEDFILLGNKDQNLGGGDGKLGGGKDSQSGGTSADAEKDNGLQPGDEKDIPF